MKIAVSSGGITLEDQVDPRFGRAKYILIVDSQTKKIEAIDNTENINAFKGAGIKAATLICDKGAEVLLTGYCGPNAFRTVKAAGIKVVSDVEGAVGDCIEALLQGKYTYSDAPNADGHW